ncbi:Protein kinase, catalytic domain-containing protein [Cynara cardunculus var. scolymus]|uniref:non-specific serine/threonine protein kinase n=1 Tax=Cynara cardunculus var. scolymus TaxID=59895 RepID=A0A103Y672_CYNCS|nr:Protein kinase, catalytic domain-containing protein [Cynara cardunculus var. scolymus]
MNKSWSNDSLRGAKSQLDYAEMDPSARYGRTSFLTLLICTPEFMAPEMYEEAYNELVDIYSFGMCVLEMLTSKYPYHECSNPAQIYKKVTSGKLPKAFYEIEDAEAQEFVGKCLENASSRPSARELLMEPFLVVEDHSDQLMVISTMPSQNPPSMPEKVVSSLPINDRKKSTDMTITGTMNQEDGKARNIYFPFDIESDTANDVATEMVKELEINDWEPFDIAKMIDTEIANLIPKWKKGSMESLQNQHHHHHSFCYDEDEDDDENNLNPFHSRSSSQASLQSLDAVRDQLDSNILNDDDASCKSSLNSFNYSNFTYCSDDEDEYRSMSYANQDPRLVGKTKNFMRFCGEERMNRRCNNRQKVGPETSQFGNIKSVGSAVDIRSQLLHQSLVAEIHKRRLFKTVAAIENIGYHEPTW